MNKTSDIIDISITDIHGGFPTNSSSIILIKGSNLSKLLKRIAKENNNSIWSINRRKVDALIKQYNLSSDLFLELGHSYYENKSDIMTIILGNSSICKRPNEVLHITKYASGNLVKPFANDDIDYESLGLFYSNGSLDLTNIGLIPIKFLKTINDDTNNNITSNNYNLVSSSKSGIKTIDLSIFYGYDKRNIKTNMKILNTNGKYLTAIDGTVKTKSKLTDKNQSFRYTAQGDLIVDGKCLSYVDKDNVNLDNCSGDDHQNWLLTNTGNIKLKNENICLTADSSDHISMKACDSTSGQDWDIEEDSDANSSAYSWDKYKGKTVVLVESDDPWYVNKDITIQKKYIKTPLNLSDLNYRPNADYKSNFIYDPDSHSLGMGFSYADHRGTPCDKSCKIEPFNGTNKNNTNQIIFYLCIVLVTLMMYRYMRK